jgi:hypothetical protein
VSLPALPFPPPRRWDRGWTDEAPIRRSGPPRHPCVQASGGAPPAGLVAERSAFRCPPTEQPTSRPCSTVVVRCDRPPLPEGVARSFHGLCSPSRFRHRSLQATRGSRAGRGRAGNCPPPRVVACVAAGIPRWLPRPRRSRSRGESRRIEELAPYPTTRLFSAKPEPRPAPRRACRRPRAAVATGEAGPSESVRVVSS